MIVGISLLFRQLFLDWKGVRLTDGYLNNPTPWQKMTYNGIFFFMSSCLAIVVVFFIYLLISKITVTPPF